MGEENLETQDKDITTNVDNNVNNVSDAAALEASVSGVTQNSEEKENDSIKERYSTGNNGSMEDEVEKENEKLKMDEGGKVQGETKESAEASKADVVNTTLANQDSKSDIVVHGADVKSELYLNEYEGYLKALNQLLYEIEGCKVTCRYKGSLNEAGKDTLRTAKQKLKQYKAIVSGKKKSLEKEYNSKNKLNAKNLDSDKVELRVNISQEEIATLENEWYKRRLLVEEDIKQGQMGKHSNRAPFPNQSWEQINSGNVAEEKYGNMETKINIALKDAAFLTCFNNDKELANEILRGIANNELSAENLTFCQMHYVDMLPYFEKYGLKNQAYQAVSTGGGQYTSSTEYYGNVDLTTAYKTGGVKGWTNSLLSKAFPNASSDQISNFSNLALAGLGIFAVYKVGKRFFGKNDKGERNILGKAGLLAAGYFVPQLLTGKDGYSMLGDILSGKQDFKELGYKLSNCLWFLDGSDKETSTAITPGILGMTIFTQNDKVSDIRNLQNEWKNSDSAWKDWYTTTYNRLSQDNSYLADEFKNTFNENKYNEAEWSIFLANLGIKEDARDDINIFDEAMKRTDKATSLQIYLKSQGLKRNKNYKKEIDAYLNQTGEFNPNDLKSEWFEIDEKAKGTVREEDLKNIEILENQVDNLGLSEDKRNKLKIAIKNFYNNRDIESKPNPENDFSLKMNGELLVLTSHNGQSTEINLEYMALEGYGASGENIRFDSFDDLLNSADLTNRILAITKGKDLKGKEIFQYKGSGGIASWKSISFNDAALLSLETDTRILSTGRWGESKSFAIIDKHTQEYAEYLSNRRKELNKVDLNEEVYPIVSKLGFEFYNENEAKKLEELLNKIKIDRGFSSSTENAQPYDIKYERKFWEGEKLIFSTVDGKEIIVIEKLSDFPTVKRNKEKFLSYMNDKRNGMWGANLDK